MDNPLVPKCWRMCEGLAMVIRAPEGFQCAAASDLNIVSVCVYMKTFYCVNFPLFLHFVAPKHLLYLVKVN